MGQLESTPGRGKSKDSPDRRIRLRSFQLSYSGRGYQTGVKKPEGPGGRAGAHMTTVRLLGQSPCWKGEADCQTEELVLDTPSEDPEILVLYLILQLPLTHRLNHRSMNFQEDVQSLSYSRNARNFNKIKWEVHFGQSCWSKMKMMGNIQKY